MIGVQRAKSSSIRVSTYTRRRVGHLARRLGALSNQEVIDKALDALERRLFWEGFDREAREYLARYPEETAERERFGCVSADGLAR